MRSLRTQRIREIESIGTRPEGHIQNNRVVVTSTGIIHDMVADGTYESGVNDVMAADLTTPIVVAASFEDGVLVLRPRDLPGVEVRRWREGEQMVWRYDRMFTTRLERIDDTPGPVDAS